MASGTSQFVYATGTSLTTKGSTYLATLGGRVGIGTTNPQSAVQVDTGNFDITNIGTGASDAHYGFGTAGANAYMNFNFDDHSLTFRNLDANGSIVGMAEGSFTFTSLLDAVQFSAASNVNFDAGGATRIFVSGATGNTGFGTTTPAAKLSVHGGGLTMYNTGDFFNAGKITSTSSSASTFPYASTTMVTSVTASTTNLIVSSAGGTAGCATLSAIGALSNTGSACGSGGGTVTGTGFAGMMSAWTSTTNITSTSTPTATAFIATSTTATSSFAGPMSVGSTTPQSTSLFQVGTSSPLLHIDKVSGKVGFGCVNSSPLRWVFGCGTNTSVNPNINLLVTDPADARMGVAVGSRGTFLSTGDATTYGAIFAHDYVGGVPMNLALNQFGGKVGVGTTTPNWTLSVVGDASIDSFVRASRFIATSSTASTLPYASTTVLSSTGATYLATAGGNVAIGAPSPVSYKLHVDSSAPIPFGVTNGANSTFTVVKNGGDTNIQLNVAGVNVIQTIAPDLYIGNDISNVTRTRFLSGGNEKAIITTNGLGVGTSTPLYTLTVASTTAPQLSLSTGAGVAQWTFRNAGGNLYGATTTVAGTATSSTPAFTIMGATGNVGIGGTSTPFGLLSVEQGTESASLLVANQGSSTPSFIVEGVNSMGFVGLGTYNPTSVLHVNMSDGSGIGYKMTGLSRDTTTDTEGVVLAMSHNASGNRQFGFYDSVSGDGVRVLGNGLDGHNLISGARQNMTLGTDTTDVTVGRNLIITTKTTTAYASSTLAMTAAGSLYVPNTTAAGVGDTFVCLDATAGLLQSGATCAASTERIKENIESFNHGLDWIRKIDPKSFNYKEGFYGGKADIGLIAERSAEIDPRLALYDEEGKPLNINERPWLAVVINSIQELDERTGGAKRSVEENWQWVVLGILSLAIVYQQVQIRKLKK